MFGSYAACRLIVRPRIESQQRKNESVPSFNSPTYIAFLIPPWFSVTDSGRRLGAQDSEPGTKIPAPCLWVNATPFFIPSFLKEYLRPLNMFCFFTVVLHNRETQSCHKGGEKKDVCRDEAEWLQDILISILSKLDVIQCRKTGPAIHHDVSGVGRFGQDGSQKTNLPVQLGIEPRHHLMCV